jgi:RNA polymerase sigma factor (sigma-70 family)
MSDRELLAERFELERRHLRAVAYRMLGSLSEADDAVQETWLRVSRADSGGIESFRGWLTTIVARVCLNTLKSRTARREGPLGPHVPDPVVGPEDGVDPEQEALLADSLGLALLVVLDALAPAERLAFVLHDIFAVPFDEIVPIVERSPAATRQLASRARRRVRAATPFPDADLGEQRELVDAFLAASREGDFGALIALLDPDVVLRVDVGAALARGGARFLRGAPAVATQSITFARSAAGEPRPALVNGTAGIVLASRGRPFSVVGFTIRRAKIVEIDVLADPARLQQLEIDTVKDDPAHEASGGPATGPATPTSS